LLNFSVGATAFVTGSEFLTGFGWYLFVVQNGVDARDKYGKIITNSLREVPYTPIPSVKLDYGDGPTLNGWKPGLQVQNTDINPHYNGR